MSSPGLSAPRTPGSTFRSALPAGVAALTVGTVAAGLLIAALSSTGLGTPLPPFLMNWAPVFQWPVLVAALAALGGVLVAPRLIATDRGPGSFAFATYLLALTLGLSINAARGGTSAWTHVFDLSRHGSFDASREYLPALAQLHLGVHYYVSHFAQLLPYLPTHVKGNPPGPVVAMHLLGITSSGRLAAVCIVSGALTAPLAYGLGRSLGGEQRGRVGALLTAFSPALILLGVTSLDYAYAALATAIAWLLVSERTSARAAGCALAAAGTFFSWLLLAIPAWALLVVLKRSGWRPAVSLAAGLAASILAFTLILVATLGYDPIAVLQAVGPIYRHGIAAHRPYPYWLFGSPVAWLVMLGLPTAWIALRSLARGDPVALALAAIIVFAALAGFTKAETERIWLPFVPLACVAGDAVPVHRIRAILLALALQALVVEILFNTVW